MKLSQRIGNGVAHLVFGLVTTYVRYSPLDWGKSRLRIKAAVFIARIALFKERLLPVSIGGRTLPLWLVPSSVLGAFVVFFGNYEVSDVDACIRALAKSPRPVLLDIGANCGLYSIFAAATCRHARVVAVEADPGVAERLRRNITLNAEAIRKNDSTIEVLELALSAESGEARFQRSWDDAFGSLAAVFARAKETILVATRRGDELVAELGVEEIDCCKLDVEGGEMLVLRGLAKTLRAGKIRLLQVELNKTLSRRAGHSCQTIVDYLREHDYLMTVESSARYAGRRWTCENFHFARR